MKDGRANELRRFRKSQNILATEHIATQAGFRFGVPPEDTINDAEEAESGTVELTGEYLEDVQRVYWSLAALDASADDYRRPLAEMAMKATGE